MLKEICEKIIEQNQELATRTEEIDAIHKSCSRICQGNGLEEDIQAVLKYFGYNFSEYAKFCNEHDIIIDFSGEYKVLEVFAESVSTLKKNEEEKIEQEGGDTRINSFDGLFLVRKMNDVYPKNDVLQPASKSFIYDESDIRHVTTHTTTHWTINHEVQPHKDASEAWIDSNVIIIQPITENIYDQMRSFNPIDSFGLGDMKLENYYILCDSQEIVQQLKKKNPSATPIVFSQDKINGSGDKFLQALGKSRIEFKFQGTETMDWNVKDSAYYTEEFLEQHPKFGRISPVLTPEHKTRDDVVAIHRFHEYLEGIASKTDSNAQENNAYSFDDFFQKEQGYRVLKIGAILDLQEDHLEDLVSEHLRKDAKIVDEIKGIFPQMLPRMANCIAHNTTKSLNKDEIDTIFDYIINSGSEIEDEGEIEKYKKLKMYFINQVHNKTIVQEIFSTVCQYKIIAQSPVMDLELDNQIDVQIPEEFMDYTDYFSTSVNSKEPASITDLMDQEINSQEIHSQDKMMPVSLVPSKEKNNLFNKFKRLLDCDINECEATFEEYIKDLDISAEEREIYKNCIQIYLDDDLRLAKLLEIKNVYAQMKSNPECTFTVEGIRTQSESATTSFVNKIMDETRIATQPEKTTEEDRFVGG